MREGILLELGFDDVTPNSPRDISSWAYDYAATKIEIIDNRARGVACYDLRYTFVEKLQTISTKFRRQQESGDSPAEFTRHYFDVCCLLDRSDVQEFIGTEPYKAHKAKRFPRADNQNIAENEAFLLSDLETRAIYKEAYEAGSALYYGDKPTFEQILERIGVRIDDGNSHRRHRGGEARHRVRQQGLLQRQPVVEVFPALYLRRLRLVAADSDVAICGRLDANVDVF
jgi:Nucleotidyl transferase AbiEii toxin, Type IV TA system